LDQDQVIANLNAVSDLKMNCLRHCICSGYLKQVLRIPVATNPDSFPFLSFQ